jgi:hypothetical protein
VNSKLFRQLEWLNEYSSSGVAEQFQGADAGGDAPPPYAAGVSALPNRGLARSPAEVEVMES